MWPRWPSRTPRTRALGDSVRGVSDASAITSATFGVVDEYGQILPSGPATVRAGRAFSFVVSLEAYRYGNDVGRVYTVIITARDAVGNAGSGSTTVRVPHDQQ